MVKLLDKKMQLKKFPDLRGPSLSGVSHYMISYFARATRNRPDIDVLQSYPDDCGNVFSSTVFSEAFRYDRFDHVNIF